MKRLMKYMRSNTVQAALIMLLTQMPPTAAPIWGVIAEAGVSDPWVARMKVAALLLGFAGVLWGRGKAKGPLK